jgi:hypothetical protein
VKVRLRLVQAKGKDVACTCALLRYYAALSSRSVPTFRDNLSVPSPRSFTETALQKRHSTLRNTQTRAHLVCTAEEAWNHVMSRAASWPRDTVRVSCFVAVSVGNQELHGELTHPVSYWVVFRSLLWRTNYLSTDSVYVEFFTKFRIVATLHISVYKQQLISKVRHFTLYRHTEFHSLVTATLTVPHRLCITLYKNNATYVAGPRPSGTHRFSVPDVEPCYYRFLLKTSVFRHVACYGRRKLKALLKSVLGSKVKTHTSARALTHAQHTQIQKCDLTHVSYLSQGRKTEQQPHNPQPEMLAETNPNSIIPEFHWHSLLLSYLNC